MTNTVTEFHASDGYHYDVTIGVSEEGPWCTVRLLPYECLLFSASLEWLHMTGYLEDGDATHNVQREDINKMIAWANENNYPWEPL